MTCTSRTYVIEQKSEKLVAVLILANQGSSTQEQKKVIKFKIDFDLPVTLLNGPCSCV
jgi:hypothetical protein